MTDEQKPRLTGPGGRLRTPVDLPLVYSCSGCSSAAQLANALAIRLDRAGTAEMSCVAGLGGDVPSLLRLARSGRPILALDGCPLVCVEATLRRHDLVPDEHVVLSRYGVRKRRHADFDEADVERLLPVAQEAAAVASRRPQPTNGAAVAAAAARGPAEAESPANATAGPVPGSASGPPALIEMGFAEEAG